MSTAISKIIGREILDSRGNPTVEVDVYLTTGSFGRAAVPSGASTGTNEAVELRDGESSRFMGKGVRRAVQNIAEVLAPALLGMDPMNQENIDRKMIDLDGTQNKGRLGANAILGISLAIARAAAFEKKVPLYRYLSNDGCTLPVPLMNLINGGKHADNPLDFQEFMIVPHGFSTFSDALRAGTEVFHGIKSILHKRGLSTAVGDEGGFAPNLSATGDVIRVLIEAIEKAGYKPGSQISIALDPASTEFYKDGKYISLKGEGTSKTTEEMIGIYENLSRLYPLVSIEDGLAENDWDGWKKLMQRIGNRVQIVGDDLFVTNPEFLARGIQEKSANAILIKLNQIGTLTETKNTIKMAAKANVATVISHRSGETEDTFIADLAVAMNAGQIKTGSLCRTDRTAKYNQLLRIEEELGKKARFAGLELFSR